MTTPQHQDEDLRPTGTGQNVQTVRQGAIWSVARSVALRTVGQLTTIAVVRIVSPDEFGIWALAFTIHSVISNLADLGVASQLIRRDTDKSTLAPSASFVALAMSLVLGIAMFSAAEPLAASLGAASAAPVVRVMALSVVLMGISAVPSSLLARDFRQNALFVASLASMVVSNTSLLLLAILGAGPLSFAWSTVLGQIAAGVFIIRKSEWVWPRPRLEPVKSLLRLGAPLSIANVVNFAYLNMDYAVVSRLKGTTVLGIYLLAFGVSSWPYAILASSINGVSMPAFSAAASVEELRSRVSTAIQTVALVSFPAAALLSTLAAPLVQTFYGGKWSEAGRVLPLLAPYGAIFLVTLVLGNVLVAKGRSGWLLSLQVLWFAALLPVMIVMVNRLGPRGAAIAHLSVVSAVAAPAYMLTVRRCAGVDHKVVAAAVRAPLVISLAAGAIAWAISRQVPNAPLALAAGLATGGAAYAFLAAPLLIDRLGGRLPASLRPVAGVSRASSTVASRLGLAWLHQ